MTTRREATARLLADLLDGHERSRSFGRPGPWPRDVIVRLDAATFPAAFAPDGREQLAVLRSAAVELERAGAVRLVRGTGWSDGEPHEVRLGPDEVAPAYAVAAAHDYAPLAAALAAVAAQAKALRSLAPAWMDGFLADVATRVAASDLDPLGMQVERFKRDHREIAQSLTAATHIAAGAAGWERVVSEGIFGDSKRLAGLRARVADLLVRADPRWGGWHPGDAQDVLETYGVRRKPGLLRCAGRAALGVGGRTYQLEDFEPIAHLPEAWRAAWVRGVIDAAPRFVTTVENETPFLVHVTEAGGPAALGDRGELVVYTAGFPAPELLAGLAQICRGLPEVTVRHWGDADLGGLKIWWTVRHRIDHQVELFRVDRAWLDAELARRPGTRLTAAERAHLGYFRRDLVRGPSSDHGDVRQALALLDGLLEHDMKLEQERG